MHTLTRRLLLIFVALGFISATMPTNAVFCDTWSSVATVSVQADGYSWTITSPIKIGLVRAQLQLNTDAGKPVVGCKLKGTINRTSSPMEGHPSPLEFKEEKDGLYIVNILFPESGTWEIALEFADEKGNPHSQKFTFNVPEDNSVISL